MDSKFVLAKYVFVKSQERDTFSIINIATGATLVWNAKYLKREPARKLIADCNDTEQSVGVEDPKLLNNSDAGANIEPLGPVEEHAIQDDQSKETISTRSGHVVKSTEDCDNFVYH